MELSIEMRSRIADQIIRSVVPVLFIGMVLNIIGVIFLSGGQYQRIVPAIIVIVLIIPTWLYNRQGKALKGISVLLACLCIGAAAGMTLSGGVHSLAYTATLALITVFVVLYGARGGLLFIAATLGLGCLFSILIHYGVLHRVDEPTTSFLFLMHAVFLSMQFFFVLVPVRLMFGALTESKRQQEQLRSVVYERKQVQDELKSILNKTPDIIYRLDRDGNITFINEAIRKYGYVPEKILGKSIMEFIHPDDRPATRQLIMERRAGERSSNDTEVRFSLSDLKGDEIQAQTGGDTWLSFLVSSEGLYSGEERCEDTYIGTQGIARDISVLRHFEHEVNRLAAIVEQAAEDVVITDKTGVIQYVNPRFEQVTGYSSAEVVGRTPGIFKSGKHDSAFYSDLWGTIKNGKIWKGRIWNRTKNGTIILQDVTITPIFDSNKELTGYASVRRDITEQARVQEQLQQAQKMEAIGTLAGGIAHDFNNILSGMIGFTELAIIDVKDRPSTVKMLERVLEAGSRATELVKQILSFSRSQKTEVKPISPLSIVKEVLKLMRASLPSTIEITQSLESDSYILADATKIHQVLMNLCTNAASAMKQDGGTLSVGLQDVFLEESDLTHHPDLLPGEYLKISVEDTGQGMTRDIREKAFDPFFTTKELGEGTGMGLATVHGIVTEIDGFISLYSEPGQGTAIHLFFPLVPDPIEIKNHIQDKVCPGGTEKILFVDDEQLQIEVARDVLTHHGYQVDTFSDSIAALENFSSNPGAYDLVITDMTMPKMTGDKLSHRIHLIRPDIPVVMCSGFSEIIDEQKAEALGIAAFLYKPVVMADLLETVRKMLD